jgi:hypothetical protein
VLPCHFEKVMQCDLCPQLQLEWLQQPSRFCFVLRAEVATSEQEKGGCERLGGWLVARDAKTKTSPSKTRGRQNKVDGPPRTKNRRNHPPSTIRFFFPLIFLNCVFWAFLGQGSSNTRQKTFYKKIVLEGLYKKFD